MHTKEEIITQIADYLSESRPGFLAMISASDIDYMAEIILQENLPGDMAAQIHLAGLRLLDMLEETR